MDYKEKYEQALERMKSWAKGEHPECFADKSDDDLEDDYSCPVMNTPCKIDRKLLWICPLPEIRKYLYEQCGYKRRWEWLYKIFWRGTYEFTY